MKRTEGEDPLAQHREHGPGGQRRGGKALIAEDGRNEPALVTETGLDGLWADDFHHMVRVLLTGEQDGYYADFKPRVADLARTIERGWLYEGQALPTSPEEHRGKPAVTPSSRRNGAS